MKLFGYWRSTTSYRVRIALNLKGLSFKTQPVDLTTGEQHTSSYTALNPIAGVPTLVLDDGTALTQSMAILDYLDQVSPAPRLIPTEPVAAAKVRAAAMVIACDIHPVNNLKIGLKLKDIGHNQEDVAAWTRHFMALGLSAYQDLLPEGSTLSFADTPTLADVCLIPQLYNAHRWELDLSPFPRLRDIEARCLSLPAFQAAHPNAQPDAPQRTS
ncbi:MAG: maleylacetoacetate isomerase [Pseudomonadota bacterium]